MEIKQKFLDDQLEEIQMLGERLIIFDICENKEVEGSSNYDDCNEKIQELEQIRNPKDFFHIGLSDSDESELVK